jgi:hypothetical protein
MISKASASFLNHSSRPDSGFAASPLSHRDARTKKLFLIWAMDFGGTSAHGPESKSLFASFSSEKEVLLLKAFS